jgi:hypothetical protein
VVSGTSSVDRTLQPRRAVFLQFGRAREVIYPVFFAGMVLMISAAAGAVLWRWRRRRHF